MFNDFLRTEKFINLENLISDIMNEILRIRLIKNSTVIKTFNLAILIHILIDFSEVRSFDYTQLSFDNLKP